MMHAVDRAVLDLSAANEALVTRSQLRELGLSRNAVAHLISSGQFERAGPRVLRRSGSPRTTKQRVLLAVLDAGPGAYLSGGPAVAWWGLPGFDLRDLQVTRPRGITSTRATFATLHQVLDLRAEHVTVLDGVPIVRPERAFIEVCATTHPQRAARMLDNAWSRGLLSGPSARRVLDELAERGRNGIAVARQILDERPDDYVPPASGLEARFAQIVGDAGLPPMRRQVDSGGERWSGRVDFRAVDLPLVVECQSERYHASLSDRADDARRRARLEADGFTVVEVWDVEIWHRPRDVVQRLLAARSLARASRSAARTAGVRRVG
jgi:very-short-patch-repair endonuclease